ncbi:hypothetical protein B6D29_00455 [Microgenomates bacterium UTCPR1]|nr:MAG: hypothetical protein B6D29_00455 [Microgenomates bacterium UTCPR1]
MNYYLKTFGCQQNHSDSERIEADLKARGMKKTSSYELADYVVINTCMVKESAENRVYGLVNNLSKLKNDPKRKKPMKIVVTGCMVGLAFRDRTGRFLKKIRKAMPSVDEFLPIEEVGFDHAPVRQNRETAWVPISNGCNNYCTFCIVPFTRGREISRPFEDIIGECLQLKKDGFKNITLLGQNVNSYGADIILGEKNVQVMRDLPKKYFEKTKNIKINKDLNSTPKGYRPVFVKHLGRFRIPTLFPQLLEAVAKIGFEKVDMVSSNPWDFSDELIDVIAKYKNITRTIHLPVQSGDDGVLKRMNRWYTAKEYLQLVNKLKNRIPNLKLTTDIIVGFCGETEEEFSNTVNLCKRADFSWAFISQYSTRPMTAATRNLKDNISHSVKEKRWLILDKLINRPHLKSKG